MKFLKQRKDMSLVDVTLWVKLRKVMLIFLLLTNVITMSFLLHKSKSDNYLLDALSTKLYIPPSAPYEKYIDSVFNDYELRANIFLNKKHKNSPIKSYMLSTCAKDVYFETGVFLPVELALAQALQESSMGLKGRSAKNNPFNIGEWNDKTVLTYKTTYEGIKAYYSFMSKTYLKCKPIDLLFKEFSNCNNYRYAHKGYGKLIANHYENIKNYLDNEINRK
jgi:hypothetical protein